MFDQLCQFLIIEFYFRILNIYDVHHRVTVWRCWMWPLCRFQILVFWDIQSHPLMSTHILLLLVIQAWMSHNFNHGAYCASNIYTYVYILSFLGITWKAVTSNMVTEVLFLMFMIFIWGFPKMVVPQNTPKWSFFSRTVGKPMVVGYHHDRKPPFEPGS